LNRYKKALLQEQEEKDKLKAKVEELEKEAKKIQQDKAQSHSSLESLQLSLTQLQLKNQVYENEKKKGSLYIFNSKTKLKQLKLDHQILKSDVGTFKRRIQEDMERLTRQVVDQIRQYGDQVEEQYSSLETKFNSFKKDSEDQVRETAGFLLKIGKTVKSWKRRWFVFRKDLTFSYFKGIEDTKALDTIDVSQEDVLDVSADISQGKPFAFKLVTRERTYFLCATNEDEKRRWISVLRRWFEVNKSYLK